MLLQTYLFQEFRCYAQIINHLIVSQLFTEVLFFLINGFLPDVFKSLANMPFLNDRLIRMPMTGVKYTLNIFYKFGHYWGCLKICWIALLTLPSSYLTLKVYDRSGSMYLCIGSG